MPTNPFFTIIIPVYNVEQYLACCLDSIFSQSFQDFELILINDGSIDGSYQLMKDYQSKYPEIVLFDQENKGQGAARNVGIQHARGQYIWFIDSDDYIPSHALAVLHEEIVKLGSDLDGVLFTYNEWEVADEHGVRVEHPDSGFDDFIATGIYKSDEILSYLFNGKMIPLCCNKVFSKKLFDQSKFEFVPGAFFEDVCFSIQMINAADRIKILRQDLYIYNLRVGSTMVSDCTEKHVYSIYRILDTVKKHLEHAGVYEQFEKEFAGFYWRHLTFIYLKFVQYSGLQKNLLFLDELSKSTAHLDMPYYLPGGENGDEFPFAFLLKFISENEIMNEEMEEKLMESFNFPQEFMDNYM